MINFKLEEEKPYDVEKNLKRFAWRPEIKNSMFITMENDCRKKT